MPPDRKKAVGLKYDAIKDRAPKVIAKGSGKVAERIIDIAQKAGVPIHENNDLVELLSKLDLYEEIPEEAYRVVAEILAWVYKLNKTYNPTQ